jgi:hypothetical protein
MVLEMKNEGPLCQSSLFLRVSHWFPQRGLARWGHPGRLERHSLAWDTATQDDKQPHWVSVPAGEAVAIVHFRRRRPPPLDHRHINSQRRSRQI